MGKKPEKIVLVITDGGSQELYDTLSFEGEKIEVHPFSKAPEVVKNCRVDLILLDCNVNVDEGLKILRNNKTSCPAVPNIFITDINLEGVVLKAFRAGARDFFKKPVNIPELRETVEGLLSVKKSSREKRAPFIKNFS